jgi:hypothetical protein
MNNHSTNPSIHQSINPLTHGSARQPLPIMDTIHDAAKLNIQHRTTFYVSAFLFQCWLSELTLAHAAQLAEKPDPKDRSFQIGESLRGFHKYFGHASDAEFPELFSHLMQFAEYPDPFAAHILEAAALMSQEHHFTRQSRDQCQHFSVSAFQHLPAAPTLHDDALHDDALHVLTRRLCDWLDSVLHFHALCARHIMPDCFDPDPQKRELTLLGINHRHFDDLDQPAQLRWLTHMLDAVDELKHSRKWSTYHRANKGAVPKPLPWPTVRLDRSIITLWPIFKHYNWSATDLLSTLRQVLKPSGLAPSPDESTLAEYCCSVLSLRHPNLSLQPHTNANPPALDLALHLLQSTT